MLINKPPLKTAIHQIKWAFPYDYRLTIYHNNQVFKYLEAMLINTNKNLRHALYSCKTKFSYNNTLF